MTRCACLQVLWWRVWWASRCLATASLETLSTLPAAWSPEDWVSHPPPASVNVPFIGGVLTPALRVHMSETTAEILMKLGGYHLESRGRREVKVGPLHAQGSPGMHGVRVLCSSRARAS